MITCVVRGPRTIISLALLMLAACGGGGGGGGGGGPPPTHTVGGTVSGLSGSDLVLADNGSDHLAVSGNGSFTFAQAVPAGGLYSVSVLTQPARPIQTCRVSNGSGTVDAGDVTSVAVTCKTATLRLFAGNTNGPGSADGAAATARFLGPQNIATDVMGNIYVVDYGADTVRKITPQGVVSTLAGIAYYEGSADGIGAAARFSYPVGIATDLAGDLYVGDDNHGNGRVRKISPAGAVSTLSLVDSYGRPMGIRLGGFATDPAGNVYVAQSYANVITQITPAGVVSTFAGTYGLAGSNDGTGSAALFYAPADIASDTTGAFYVADSDNSTIRKITPAGVVSTFAGTAGISGSADGPGASASFNVPIGIATDTAGNVYVVERPNNTVRKTTPAGVVTTLAGTAGVQGNVDGKGAAAQFNEPSWIHYAWCAQNARSSPRAARPRASVAQRACRPTWIA